MDIRNIYRIYKFMELRAFQQIDTPALIELFRQTVHAVCRKDYSKEQLEAWAPESIDLNKWIVRLSGSYTIVAESKSQIVGFANLDNEGCIDMFYVAAECQSQGVGSLLFEALEKRARMQGLDRLRSDVSLTARQFFLSKGFIIEKEYIKNVGTVTFPNTLMAKLLI